jgi:hypothetical protein
MRTPSLFLATSLLACGSSAPTEAPPRTQLDLAVRLTTPGGAPVEGARVVIRTWPPADGLTDRDFTGFLITDAEGMAGRTAGPFGGGVLDSVEVFANPASTCTWNPVRTVVREVLLDTLPAEGLEITVEVPDSLARARAELGVMCAQGTELARVPGHLSYDMYLEVKELVGTTFSGTWALAIAFAGWADGVFSATVAGGAIGLLLTPTDGHPLCDEIRLIGTVRPDGTWGDLDVVTPLVIPTDPCIAPGHRYRFFKSKLTRLP